LAPISPAEKLTSVPAGNGALEVKLMALLFQQAVTGMNLSTLADFSGATMRSGNGAIGIGWLTFW
jgi:hypothetical protein